MASVDRVTPKNVKLSLLKSSRSVVNRPTLSVEMSEVSGSQFNLVLYNALENYKVVGLPTNIKFLKRVLLNE